MQRYILKEPARILIVYPAGTVRRHDVAAERLALVRAECSRMAVTECVGRDDLSGSDVGAFSLVVSLGGDGTMLDVSGVVGGVPLLPLRLMEDSVGFLCSASSWDAGFVFGELSAGRCWVERLPRIGLRVNGADVVPSAQNDILIANESPARASRYELRVGATVEQQCSSGIWLATASGSHGAARSAGARPLPREDGRFVLRVRELGYSDAPAPCLESAFLPDESPSIVIRDHHLCAFGDGDLWRVSLHRDDVVTVVSGRPVSVVRLSVPGAVSET